MLQLVCAPLPADKDLCYCLQFEHLVWFHTRAPVVSGKRCSPKALKSLPGFYECSFSGICFTAETFCGHVWLKEQERVGRSLWAEISYFLLCIYNCSFEYLITKTFDRCSSSIYRSPVLKWCLFCLFVFPWQLDASSSYSPVNNVIDGRWVTNRLQTSLAVSICNLLRVIFLRSLSSCDCQISCSVPLHSFTSDFRITFYSCFLFLSR